MDFFSIKKRKALRQLFVKRRLLVIMGKEGYGHSYNWENRHLFFEAANNLRNNKN
jgi:hypothetical protein